MRNLFPAVLALAHLLSPQIALAEKSPILPTIEMEECSVREAFEILRTEIRRVTPPNSPSEAAFSNLILIGEVEGPKITLSLKNVPTFTAIDYVVDLAGLRLVRDSHGTTIFPITSTGPGFSTRVIRVFLKTSNQHDPIAFLKARGVTFPDGSMVVYISEKHCWVVRNSDENIKRIAEIAESLTAELILPSRPLLKIGKRSRLDGRDAALHKIQAQVLGLSLPEVVINTATLSAATEALGKLIPRDHPPIQIDVSDELKKTASGVQVDLRHVPLIDAVRCAAMQVQGVCVVTPGGLSIYPEYKVPVVLHQQSFHVPPELWTYISGNLIPNTNSEENWLTPSSLKDALEIRGVVFPEGASCSYNTKTMTIEMTNTVEALDLLIGYLESEDESRRWTLIPEATFK